MFLCICSIFAQIVNYEDFTRNYFLAKEKNQEWLYGRSSSLIDNYKDKGFYERSKLCDGDLNTVWVEGVRGDGIGEYIFLPIFDEDGAFFDYCADKNIKITLKINNGYCSSKDLFYANNRVKQAKITIYTIPVSFNQAGDVSAVHDCIEENSEAIYLEDKTDLQNFFFEICLFNRAVYHIPFVVMKFEILDVYKGTKYDDTCISEMNVYGEYLKEE